MNKKELEKMAAEPQYRLVCEGCTKDVLKSSNVMTGVKVVCPSCGKEQMAKRENFIAL